MAWMIREDKLDVHQREFINTEARKKGSIWIQGFAGSGKSVLLVHHIRSVLEREPNASIALVVYTLALVDLFKSGLKELGINRNVSVMTPYEFDKNQSRYDYILCDEVQDLPRRVLDAMRSRGGQVIVAGDSNQSIYERDAKWNEPVVSPGEIGVLLDARPFVLQIVHRLTRSIIRAVNSLLPTMNIFGTANDPTKQDTQIRIGEAHSFNTEIAYVWKEAQKRPQISGGQETSAILLPHHNAVGGFFTSLLQVDGKMPWTPAINKYGKADYNSLNRHLKSQNLKIQFVGNGYGSLQEAIDTHSVIVMTYHSAKGLDFDDVFLPGLDASLRMPGDRTKVLFMVAMTRSRKNLYITHTGFLHPFVDQFANLDACTKIDIQSTLAPPKPSSENYDF